MNDLAQARSAQLEDRKMTRDAPTTYQHRPVNKYFLLALFGARLDKNLVKHEGLRACSQCAT